jgi:hypothetical protein
MDVLLGKVLSFTAWKARPGRSRAGPRRSAILASAPEKVDELAFEMSLRRMDGETEQAALAVMEEAGFKLAVEPDWKVIESIVFPLADSVFQCLIEAETDGIPAGGFVVEPGAEIGGEEPSEEGFNRIGHGVSFAGGGRFAAF